MKKAIIALISLSLLFGVSGCNNLSNKEKQPTKDNEVKQPIKNDKTNNEKTSQNEKEVKNQKGNKTNQKENKLSAKKLVKKVLRNKNARLAIAHAIDKNKLTKTLGNYSKTVDYLVPYGFVYGKNKKEFREAAPQGYIHFDKKQAKEYWQKAKEEVKFENITLELMTFDTVNTKKIANVIKDNLEEVLAGIKIVVINEPFAKKLERYRRGDYDIQYTGWSPDYSDPLTYFDIVANRNGVPGNNKVGYKRKEFYDIIDSSRDGALLSKPDERWKALQKAEKILLEDAAIIPLYQVGSSILIKSTLKGVESHKFGALNTYSRAETANVTYGKNILRFSLSGDIPSFDCNKANDMDSFLVLACIKEGLVSLDANDNVIPGLAESWKKSKDGKKWTFKLRDAKWSNGDKITAQNFVDSFRRLADPATKGNDILLRVSLIKNSEKILKGELAPEELGVKAKNDKTLIVELEKPLPFFLSLMTSPNFYPINKKFVDSCGKNYGKGIKNVICCGPYILDRNDSGYACGISKNPDYWNVKNVKNDGVLFRVLKDTKERLKLYEENELDTCWLVGEYVEKYKGRKDFKNNLGHGVFYLGINTRITQSKEKTKEK